MTGSRIKLQKNASAKSTAKKYHHGNVSAALISAGLEMIESEDISSLTLRAVGSRIGVSRSAIYRHFENKEDLLIAIATDGFQRLHNALQKAKAQAKSSHLKEIPLMTAAYLKFARENAAAYRLMFGAIAPGSNGLAMLAEAASGAFSPLPESIALGQSRGKFKAGNPIILATAAWSSVHGLSMLYIDGKITEKGFLTCSFSSRKLLDATIEMIMQGLQN